jgi:hypothetical protein
VKYDLHTHSTVSDGLFPPEGVVRKAAAARLDGIALSDHDSTAGLEAARAEGERAGIEVLTACEVSAEIAEKSVHILAYFVDTDHPRWAHELQQIRDERRLRAEKMVVNLQALGVPVTMEMVERNAGGQSIVRPHVAMAMVEAGAIRERNDAFTDEWIGEGGRAYVPKHVMSPEDTIALIREAGGVAVVAHPIWIERDIGDSEGKIEKWTELGLGGVEVHHPEHDETWRARYANLADQLGLIVTSSSDFHGDSYNGTIGANTAGADTVAALRARAGGTAA